MRKQTTQYLNSLISNKTSNRSHERCIKMGSIRTYVMWL